MEKRHIAVWIGLVLNLVFLGIISYIPAALEPYRDELDYQMQQLIEVLPYVKILMTGGIAAQLLSLAFLRNQPKAGLVFAMIGGIIFIPLGFIFIVGYLYDYSRVIYRSLKTVPKLAQLPFEVLLKFNKQRQINMVMLYGAIGVVLLVMGMDIGGIMVAMSIVLLINARRIQYYPMLAIVGDNLLFTPGQYAVCYEAPLSAFTVMTNSRSVLKLHIKTGELNRVFRIAKSDLAEDENNTLDKILARLERSTLIQ
ncbi:hypothetical protein KWI08_04420 [Morganella morganii]|uniref:hypothetical protein n=1 Tax=Morganella morganii TaxID=582 RepID=UPI0021D1B57E|nr:hypothetical protein [Morganella morganii]MCU6273161.1 hypothetical protein [Morganella morganii]